jgi:hypothetical protein
MGWHRERSLDGETGSTVDSHRLAAWAYTHYGADVQNRLVDVLFRQFFSNGKTPFVVTASCSWAGW